MKYLLLKAARAALDLSQQELAERVGVSRQTINAIDKGDYNPTINLCLKICHALGKRWMNSSGSRPAVPPASAVGSVQTQTRPTSRGRVCCVSFRMGRWCVQTAAGPRAGACRLRRWGRRGMRGNGCRPPKRDSQGSGPLSGCGQSPPFSPRDGCVDSVASWSAKGYASVPPARLPTIPDGQSAPTPRSPPRHAQNQARQL